METDAPGLPLRAHPAQLTTRRRTRRPPQRRWPPPIYAATVAAALGELHAAGLANRRPRPGPADRPVDAGIPARVIDELMGHQASSRGGLGRSVIGVHYRHTTPEMAARVVDAIQQRLMVVLGVAELTVERHPNRSALRVF